MRLAFARFQQESNALSPVTTTRQDFERAHYLEGPALLEACGPKQQEVEGFLKHAELSGFVKAAREHDAELVPLFSAWAITGGPIERPVFDEFCQQILDGLAVSGPLDGFF
ncbi:MAG: M81 family metallopeptidase, partial [Myxococcota bacterium]